MSKKNALPVLPFGEDIAIVHESAQQFGELIERAFPGVEAYDPLSKTKAFRSKTVTLKLPTASLVASSISPTHVERRNNPLLTFLLPMGGQVEAMSQMGGKRMLWGTHEGGIFLPQSTEKMIGSGGFRSQLMWNLERNQLMETAKAMLGTAQPLDLRLEEARVLPKAVAGVTIDASMSAMLPMLHLYRKQPELLSGLGLEDLLYRQTVMLLRPDLFENSEEKFSLLAPKTNKQKLILNQLCEYIMAHLSDRLSLTDLEIVSGLSARSLQMAFNQHHGCTPMAWIKEQRLLKVRHELLRRKDDTPIEGVALAVGFQTMPSFFLAYKQKFGETPGQTRKKG